MKLTGWYSGDQKPVRVGVYERKYTYELHYCWFDGINFGFSSEHPKNAYDKFNHHGISPRQSLPWRGVTK